MTSSSQYEIRIKASAEREGAKSCAGARNIDYEWELTGFCTRLTTSLDLSKWSPLGIEGMSIDNLRPRKRRLPSPTGIVRFF